MPTLSSIITVWRCSACPAVVKEQTKVGEVVRGELDAVTPIDAPTGWVSFALEGPPFVVWLCPPCNETPDESRAIVALKLGVRFHG